MPSIPNRPNPFYFQKDRIRPHVFLNLLLTVTLAAIAITPILSRNFSYIGNLVIFSLWLVSAFIVNGAKIRLSSNNKVAVWWLVYIGWLLFMFLIGHSNVSMNFLLIRIPIYFIPIMTLFIVKKYNYKELLYLGKGLFIIVAINVISNIIIGIQNPTIFSELNGLDAGIVDKTTNTGDTLFVAICLFTMAICWIIFQNTHRSLYNFFSVVLFVLMGYYLLILNTRSTALIILLIMVVLFMVMPEPKSKHKRLNTIFIIIVVLLFLTFALVPTLDALVNLFSSSQRMSDRLNDILELTQSGNIDYIEDGSLAQRYILSMTSLSTFTSSIPRFLIGIGEDIHGYNFYDLLKCGVGGHSEFFDCLAKYGIVGGYLVIKVLSSTMKYIYGLTVSTKIKSNLKVVMITFIIYSFLNTSFLGGVFYVLFMLLPIVILLIDTENKKHIENNNEQFIIQGL